MALPQGGKTPWPPEGWKHTYNKYCEHDAWYSGDPMKLARVFASQIWTPTPRGRHWAKDIGQERRVMLHVPIAGDIAQTSSDLLFSEAPRIRIPGATSDGTANATNKTQDRLDIIVNNGGVLNRLVEAAESSAAIGGVFLKVNWDVELAPFPIFGVAQADTAIPEFKWGILQAVSFWREIEVDKDVYWRHIERHEVINGKGCILNGLYKGSSDELGMQISLAAHPTTMNLLPEIVTTVPSLLTRYVPNMKPNRSDRGSSIGQSDYAGVEGLMDALDEVYTSWMRDIRLGQGRIIVPESWLDVDPTTGQRKFDVDQEVYTSMDVDPLSAKEMGITVNQFDIRTDEHAATAKELIHRITANAGYSPQTFGLDLDSVAESGTALNIRERKSFLTKSKKERYFRPAIEDILEIMLMIDNDVFRSGIVPQRPSVEFSDSIAQDINQIATAVELINRAQAASIKTKIKMVHPDWTDDQVEAEAKDILNETGTMTTETSDLPV